MSNNFRRFNARCGVLFVFQNRVERLLTWRTTTHTLSFLALYTFICLDPALITVVPLAICVFYIMIPAFLARHPPPPEHLPTDLDMMYPLSGPPLALPPRIKPAPELSKDFFRNMRDLQNSMEDFSRVHDAIIANVAPPTNFSNEAWSSTLFIILLFTCFALFISAHLIPWRFIFLVGGLAAIGSGHPQIQALLETPENKQMLETQEKEAESQFQAFSTADIILDPEPEKREVEIFELQYKPLYADAKEEWEAFVFSPSPYNPLSPARIAGDRPRGTRFFEDVEAPKGWRWADKKWTLDLLSKEWVEERMITGVEVEVAGERWVTDILYDDDNEVVQEVALRPKTKIQDRVVTWEEAPVGGHKLGEWRRRRWVRVVERIPDKRIREEVLVSED
jgi:Integral peroxisomal membrane peroxin